MSPATLHIALFGQPRVAAGDGAREYVLPRKTLNVLAYLILSKRAPTRDAVAFALFPDEEEEQARSSLRRNLSYLLSSLPPASGGEPFVRSDGDRLSWNPAADAVVDVLAFERAIAEGRDDDALAHYAGMLLPTLYDEWTIADRERLRESANAALARSIVRDRSLRRFDAATASARRLLEDDPWREDIVRQLMAIRYEAGDRASALATFAQFAARMHDEMRAEPMPETTALRELIMRGARLATSEPVTREHATITFGLPFVGRDEAFRTAVERWHTSAEGNRGALFVTGEAGIGKSRFVSELARTIEREGGTVVVGETTPGGERHPYEAVLEALRSAPPGGGARRTDAWHAMVEKLLEEHAHATIGDDRSARIRLFETILKALRELARTRPIAVVLEDLHWAGEATTELIGYLLERQSAAPILMIGTYRDDALPRVHAIRRIVRTAEHAQDASLIHLRRLTVHDAVAAARAASPDGVADASVAAAATWSEGVPLLLSEAVHDLSTSRAFTGGTFATVIEDRFAQLLPQSDSAVAFGAVLGARFELDSLGAATGWRDDELVDALAPAMELGLVRSGPRGGANFAFSHHLIHAAALARIDATERIRMHALVANALLTMHPGRERALEIANHYAAAGNGRRAAASFAAGARYALDVFANADARDAATAGLAWTTDGEEQRDIRYELVSARQHALARLIASEDQLADAELLCELAGSDGPRLYDALERLVAALRHDEPAQRAALARLGACAADSVLAAAIFEKATATEADLRGDFPLAVQAYARAARVFEDLGDEDAALRVRVRAIRARVALGEYAESAASIAAIRPLLEASSDLPLRMDFHLAASYQGGDFFAASLDDAERSLELAVQIGDRFGEATARLQVAMIANAAGQSIRAMAETRRAITIFSDVGERGKAAPAMLNLASSRGWLGDYAAAFQVLDEVEALKLDQPLITFQIEAHRGSLALRAGSLDVAERSMLAARRIAGEMGFASMDAHCAMYVGEIYARSGRFAEALVEFDAARKGLREHGFPAAVAELESLVARVHCERNDATAARASIAEAERIACELPAPAASTTLWWNLAAASALLDGETESAERFARNAARGFCDEALAMDADHVECYGRHPWHIDTFALLGGRAVSLRLAEERAARPNASAGVRAE